MLLFFNLCQTRLSRQDCFEDNSTILPIGSEKMLKRGLKIALVQLSVGPDKANNVSQAVSEIHKAKEKGAQVVALPECFNSPYGTKFFEEYAEEVPAGETCRALSRAAAEAGVCVVGGTVPERCGDKLYNSCTVWDARGKLLAHHRKMHLFDIDVPNKITFKESDVLSAGDQITTFDYEGVRIGIGICYDVRFGEMAHLMANKGCSLLIYPGAFNMTTGPRHWELLGRARANDQQLWVALVSPARDPAAGYVAWGHSMVVDPWAEVVGKLDEKPGTLVVDIDFTKVEEVRSQIPIRSQRRTDVYDTIEKK
ncbi:omega-amidase NIT2-A isoform X1 [Amyelois transitella]|uniref:omega-amidase NIT2-A isoform X1 n=1 Tax=Amyelois transitella TaxID=680683 RepID=UPI0029902412|nr:omega-amidase NIT2-A isoform X1 [Amyelois transitella]